MPGRFFRHALAANPENYLARVYYGRYLRQTGQLDLAQSEFQQAIGIMPKLAFSYTELSDLLASKGKTDEAMAPLYDILKIRPDLPDARCKLATLLFAKNRVAEAESELAEGIKLNPFDAGLHLFLAHALAQEKKYCRRRGGIRPEREAKPGRSRSRLPVGAGAGRRT